MTEVVEQLQVLARIAGGGYFIWTGCQKLSDPRRFWRNITEYRISGPRFSRVLAALLPPIEIMSGLLFAVGFFTIGSASVLLVLLGLFSLAMIFVMVRRIDTDCGCGGNSPSPVRPHLVVRNAAVAAAVVFGTFSTVQPQAGAGVVMVAAIAVGALASAYLYRAIARSPTRP